MSRPLSDTELIARLTAALELSCSAVDHLLRFARIPATQRRGFEERLDNDRQFLAEIKAQREDGGPLTFIAPPDIIQTGPLALI